MVPLFQSCNVATGRPTPPHLTSVLAEQLLARACENEADNAKRMRMGMEPVSQVRRMVSLDQVFVLMLEMVLMLVVLMVRTEANNGNHYGPFCVVSRMIIFSQCQCFKY